MNASGLRTCNPASTTHPCTSAPNANRARCPRNTVHANQANTPASPAMNAVVYTRSSVNPNA